MRDPVVECVVSWDRPFDQPVPLPSGGAARTLRDAANYIKEMPKSERDKPEWRRPVRAKAKADEVSVKEGPALDAGGLFGWVYALGWVALKLI